MLRDGRPYFIDYQGGRRGALQYDLASSFMMPKPTFPSRYERTPSHYIKSLKNRRASQNKRPGLSSISSDMSLSELCRRWALTFPRILREKRTLPEKPSLPLEKLRWLLDNVHLPRPISRPSKVGNASLNPRHLKNIPATEKANMPLRFSQ
jgi:hypothetical protein